VSQDYVSQHIIICAALMLQSSLVPAHDIQLPDAELDPGDFNWLIRLLNTALRGGFYREVIATIKVR